MRALVISAIILYSRLLQAAEFPRVTADLAAYDEHVTTLEAEFSQRPADPHDKEWVRQKLAHMVEVDQYMRRFSMTPGTNGYSDAERQEFNDRFVSSRFRQVDARNTADLKQLLEIHGWFTIGGFGERADFNAWLLVQHADEDREFQKRVLGLLEPLVATGETRREHYAYLYDRVSKPQRYGTQGRCVGKGQWEPLEVEDPARLDERRASVGLAPEAEYQKQFKDLCFDAAKP